MPKLLWTILLTTSFATSFAQNPSLQNKLYYTCKVWGFVKYYHSNVNQCNVNWDSVLLHTLPLVKNAVTNNDFNDALDTMLAAAGPMDIATYPFPDTLSSTLKRNRNWGWTDDAVFRTDVRTILDTIKNNFRRDYICSVTYDTIYIPPGGNGGYMLFPNDVPFINVNTVTNYPDEFHRLLMFYKYWNIINYFNPYNYVLDQPTDTLLNNHVVFFDTVSGPHALFNGVEEFSAHLDDAHIYQLTYNAQFSYPGQFTPRIMVKYIEGKYVVVKSAVPSIFKGDVILEVDGKSTQAIEDSLRNYISAGNNAALRKFVSQAILSGPSYTVFNLTVQDTNNNVGNYSVLRNALPSDYFFPTNYYPADSLNHINWCIMDCGIGYINIGNISTAGCDSAYAAMQNLPAIIIDYRNYPVSNSERELPNLMFPMRTNFVKFTIPDLYYPGTFFWYGDTLGVDNNPQAYNGTIIGLINERTQSAAEEGAMTFDVMPNYIKVGSQTAGADGNITYFELSQDNHSGFSSIGVYYPNYDSTQRIGIVPDVVATPTMQGVIHGRDEVLEKALEVGCQVASVPQVTNAPEIKIYPNPASDLVNIDINTTTTGNLQLQLTDVTGKAIAQKELSNASGIVKTSFDIKGLPQGVYFINMTSGNARSSYKLVKI